MARRYNTHLPSDRGYSRQRQRIIRAAVEEGRRLGVSRKLMKAAIEAHLVETLPDDPNPPESRSDRDSAGPLQQRRSSGYRNRRNPRAAFRQFYQRGAKIEDRYSTSAALAQGIQVSAHPGRYAAKSGEAGKLLRRFGGARSSRGGGGITLSRRETDVQRIPGVDRSKERSLELLAYFRAKRGGDPGAIGQVADVAGYRGRRGLLTLAGNLERLEDVPEELQVRSREVKERIPGFGGRRRGDEDQQIVRFSRLAHKGGLTTVSGKRSTVKTASGGVSDHFRGNTSANARDWSGNPKEMRAVARQIARELGTRYKPGVTNVVKGGYRYQLLHETNVGGDHFDHVHLGIKRVGRKKR